MKYLVGLVVCLILVASVAVASAAPVGNIAIPSKGMLKKGMAVGDVEDSQFSLVISPEMDFIFNRKLESRIGKNEFNFYGAKIGATVANKGLVYFLLGGGDVKQEFTISGQAVKYDTNSAFIWGAGGTVVVWEYEPFVASMDEHMLRIGVDARYRRIELDVEELTVDGAAYMKTGTTSVLTSATYEANEWQIAPALSYQFNNFVPYIGVKYSDIDGDAKALVSGTEYKQDLKADGNIGVFGGIDIVMGNFVSINIEGRMIDEEALTLSANARF